MRDKGQKMESLAVKAFAKVNMRLEVRGKRPDGYHEIETLFRGIALYDTLTLTKESDGVTLVLEGRDGESGPGGEDEPRGGHMSDEREVIGGWNVPDGPANLAWQAADMLREAYPDRVGGVRIRLEKRIPVAAGLGGGSADAAAVLLGMDRLYGLGLRSETLAGFASRLGSDVAFCMAPLIAVGRGRGEVLEPLTLEVLSAVRATQAPSVTSTPIHQSTPAQGFPMWILLVKPPFSLSTGAVYGAWRPPEESDGDGRGSLSLLLQGIRENHPALVWQNMVNDLLAPACSLESGLDAYIRWVEEEAADAAAGSGDRRAARNVAEQGEGGLRAAANQDEIIVQAMAGYRVILCGSGPTIAVCFADEAPARRLEERLRQGVDRLGEILSLRSRGSRDAGATSQNRSPAAGTLLILLTRTLTQDDLDTRFTGFG